MRCRHLLEKNAEFCGPNVLTKFFHSSLKKRYDIYGNNLCLSYQEIYFVKVFNPCRRLCGAMNSLVYWNDEYTSVVLCYIFRRNAEFIFAIGFKTVFCGTYFCDWYIQNCILGIEFLQFRANITKISSATIYDHRNFCL